MTHHQVLIIGGGNAGVSLAARLLRDGTTDVAIVEGQPVHRYRPLLNYVGGGQAGMRALERPMGDVIPDRCRWIRSELVRVDPDSSSVHTSDGQHLTFESLVLCPGLTEDWDATPGLHAAYEEGWAASTFVPSAAQRVWRAVQSLRSGTVLFNVPPEPAPCGATALKPLFMACDHWRRTGALQDLDVRLLLPGSSVLGLPEVDEVLERHLRSYGVGVLRDTRLVTVDGASRSVEMESSAGSQSLNDLAFAHVVPRYRAPSWIEECGLSDGSAAGLIDVDSKTLRSRLHETVWALGDAANLATRPSGGALRRQVDVLAGNLAAASTGEAMQHYDGYTVMPITVSRHALMLIEVDRDGRPSPSVSFPDLTKPRRATWWFDRYALPRIYFRRILRGRV